MSDEEKTSFLDPLADRDSSDRDNIALLSKQRRRNTLFLLSSILNILLSIACVLFSVAVLQRHKRPNLEQTSNTNQLAKPFSPANAFVEYEYRSVVGNDTRFTGPPGPVWQRSMDELLTGTFIRFSQEEIDLYGSSSIPLQDGGYAGTIGVGHHLHCVKKIKKFLYPEHFYPHLDLGSPQMVEVRDHADHCLDWIRQALLCYVDTSMYTIEWHGSENPRHKVPEPQRCVNWDKLHDWMVSRAANRSMLVRDQVSSE